MDANLLAALKRQIFGLFCLVLLAQSLVAIPATTYHNRTITTRHSRYSRAARTIKSRDEDAGRLAKFSKRGPVGINITDPNIAKIKGVPIGIIPDVGDTGGRPQTIDEIIHSLKGKKPAVIGRYAQLEAGKTFDGSQLLAVKKEVKASGAVFSPSIMPTGGWAGLKYNNNHQAVAIAKVLQQFTDDDIPVIVRLAHEANWYQRTHEYPGHVADFKEAWAVFAAAIREHARDVLLHWSPNVADMEEYHKYAPDNMDRDVDLVGFDYYPKSKPGPDEFIKKAKEFHDTFAIHGRKFALGEAGLHYAASYEERVAWLVQIAESKRELPNLAFILWYNCQKEQNYKLAGDGLSTTLLTEKLE